MHYLSRELLDTLYLLHTCRCRPGPQDGECDGDDAGGDEDAGEVVGPGEVEVDGPAEEAERDGEEGAEDDAPVLVVEQALLVLLVLLVHRARVVRLHQAVHLGPGHTVKLRKMCEFHIKTLSLFLRVVCTGRRLFDVRILGDKSPREVA